MSKQNKNIVIIGAGITGLCTALALKQQQPDLQLTIYEQNSDYLQIDFVTLWKSSIKSLLDLGLGKRLSRIASPLTTVNTTIIGTEINLQDKTQDLSMLSVRRCDLIRMLLTALIDPSFCDSNEFIPMEPNNSTVQGISSDLATPGWFVNEQFEHLLEGIIQFGTRLESIRFMASNGQITCLFSDNSKIEAYMLLGTFVNRM